MITLATIKFLAELLKFVAVPAGLFELLEDSRRVAIDRRIASFSKEAWGALPATCAIIWIACLVCALVGAFPYQVALFLTIAIGVGVILLFFFWAEGAAFLFAAGFVLGLISLPGMFLFWILPADFGIARFFIFDNFADWLTQRFSLLDWLFFDLDVEASWRTLKDLSLEHRKTREALSDIKLSQIPTLFMFEYNVRALQWAKGLFVLLILLLNIATIALVVLVPLTAVSALIHGFYRFSDFLKTRFALKAKTRIPVGAAALWALGESASFATSAYLFWTS